MGHLLESFQHIVFSKIVPYCPPTKPDLALTDRLKLHFHQIYKIPIKWIACTVEAFCTGLNSFGLEQLPRFLLTRPQRLRECACKCLCRSFC